MADTRDSEIARIESELAQLRGRHATLVSSVRYYLPFAVIAGALMACFLVYSIAVRDIAAIVTAVLILLALLAVAVIAQLAPRHKALYDALVSPWGTPEGGISIERIERDIAEREQRLAELKRPRP